MKENERPLKPDFLRFLPLRFRELLQRLATKDKREEIPELLWLIEEYAAGRLKYSDDGATPTPRVSLDGHGPRPQFPGQISARLMPSRDVTLDPLPPQE